MNISVSQFKPNFQTGIKAIHHHLKTPDRAPNVSAKTSPALPPAGDGTSINFGLAIDQRPILSSARPATVLDKTPALSELEAAASENGLLLSATGGLLSIETSHPSLIQTVGAPFSLRMPDMKAIRVSPETIAAQKMTFMNEPSEVKGYFNNLMGDKSVKLATAGYSAPPEGYEAPTTNFLTGLAKELDGDVGFVTSPTADKGSIDAITSTVGQREGAPIGYITADSYLRYVNPDNFPMDINKEQFANQPKISFPDADVYSKATADLSNSFLVTGGRNASINDFKNAVSNGNQVVVLTNNQVKSAAWDPNKGRVDNASAYLEQLLSGNTEGIPMDDPFNQEIAKFLFDNKDKVSQHVICVDTNNPSAVKTAANHLRATQ